MLSMVLKVSYHVINMVGTGAEGHENHLHRGSQPLQRLGELRELYSLVSPVHHRTHACGAHHKLSHSKQYVTVLA